MISSTANPYVKRIRSLAADRRERRRERIVVLEGVRLLADALASGAKIELALYDTDQLAASSAGQALLVQLAPLTQAYPATARVVAAAADTMTPQGVVALAHWPEIAPGAPGIALVIDGVQDPGNLGTLLRSAEAVGVMQVFCTSGTVDAYAPKVVRGAMGAYFRLAIGQDLSWEQVGERLANVDQIYAADASATLPYYAVDWRQRAALVIGSEAHGLSEAARSYATRLVGIPMRGQAESLNAAVAGSILLFEALRQRSLGRS